MITKERVIKVLVVTVCLYVAEKFGEIRGTSKGIEYQYNLDKQVIDTKQSVIETLNSELKTASKKIKKAEKEAK